MGGNAASVLGNQFPGGSVGDEPPATQRHDICPSLDRKIRLEKDTGNTLRSFSCSENPTDKVELMGYWSWGRKSQVRLEQIETTRTRDGRESLGGSEGGYYEKAFQRSGACRSWIS